MTYANDNSLRTTFNWGYRNVLYYAYATGEDHLYQRQRMQLSLELVL